MENIWEKVARQIDEEFKCEHREIEIRRKDFKNGAVNFQEQCLRCGWSSPYLKKSSISAETMAAAVPVDKALERSWRDKKFQRSRELGEEGKAKDQEEFWSWYNAYLQSDKWRDKRRRVLTRDKNTCQGCLSAPATQVHHLSYRNVGKELLFELTSVCESCHARVHGQAKESFNVRPAGWVPF